MKWYYDTWILSIILLPDRDQSGKQGIGGQERRNSYSQATTDAQRYHQDATVTMVEQQHGIHLRCWAPCGSHCWYSEVEDHKMLCPSEQTRVCIWWGIHASGTGKPIWSVDGIGNKQSWTRKIHRECSKQEILWLEQWGDETIQPMPPRCAH